MQLNSVAFFNFKGLYLVVTEYGKNMGKTEKLLEKFGNSKNTFPYKDLVVLLSQLGYEKFEMAGSRVRFFNEKTEHMILLHRPHPENEIKGGALKAVKQALKQEGFL
ncbi:type II toxin-antitoxin system HicA family toxin [Acinetobacter sp. YH12108]|nr:type II toxin-antitoxin system HicA family toxin [Acinetobacter sp. YH12108]